MQAWSLEDSPFVMIQQPSGPPQNHGAEVEDIQIPVQKVQKLSKFVDVDPVTLSWKDVSFSVSSSQKQADRSTVRILHF